MIDAISGSDNFSPIKKMTMQDAPKTIQQAHISENGDKTLFTEAGKNASKLYAQINQLQEEKSSTWINTINDVIKRQNADQFSGAKRELFAKSRQVNNANTESMNILCEKLIDINEETNEYISSLAKNCIMVTDKDRDFAEKFLNLTEYYSKAGEIERGDSYRFCEKFSPYENVFKYDFKKIGKGFKGDVEDFVDLLDDMLEEAEKNYQKTKRTTILDISTPRMEEILTPSTQGRSSILIAHMKDIMDSCAEDFHTQIRFITTDPDNLEPIALAPHRVVDKIYLGEMGIKKEDVEQLLDETGAFKQELDDISEIYKKGAIKYLELDEKIPELEKQAKILSKKAEEEVKTASKSLGESVENSLKLVKKRFGILGGVIAAIGIITGAIIYIKKSKNKNIQNKSEQTDALKVPAQAASNQTSPLQISTQENSNLTNNLNTNFSNFLNSAQSGK